MPSWWPLPGRGTIKPSPDCTRATGSDPQTGRSPLSGTLPDAEDKVQCVFQDVHKNLDRLQGDARFTTWRNRIVTNHYLMRVRGLNLRRVVHADAVPTCGDSFLSEPPEPFSDPESGLVRAEVSRLVRAGVQRLPALLCEALILKYFEQITTVEAAEALGLTLAATKSRLWHAPSGTAAPFPRFYAEPERVRCSHLSRHPVSKR